MAVSYKKLWKLLIDRDMKKSDLERSAGITHYSLSNVLCKICGTLGCTLDDIVDFLPDEN